MRVGGSIKATRAVAAGLVEHRWLMHLDRGAGAVRRGTRDRALSREGRVVTAGESEVDSFAMTRDTEAQESWAMALPIALPRARHEATNLDILATAVGHPRRQGGPSNPLRSVICFELVYRGRGERQRVGTAPAQREHTRTITLGRRGGAHRAGLRNPR